MSVADDRYNRSGKGLARNARYDESEKGKARYGRYQASWKGMARWSRYDRKRTLARIAAQLTDRGLA